MKVEFWVEKRYRVLARPDECLEWALFARIKARTAMEWCLATWDHEPSDDEIDFAKKLTLRACRFYHTHMYPEFDLEEQK